jgi:hypothetical protein
MVKMGGAYINNVKISQDRPLGFLDFIDGNVVLIRTGKRTHRIVHITS